MAAIVNARIAYNIQNPEKKKKTTAKKFRLAVINGLLEGYSRDNPTQRMGRKRTLTLENRLNERHFVSFYKNGNAKHRPNCIVCTIVPKDCKMNGKGPCRRHQTKAFCDRCPNKPPLCVTPCFETYHTLKKFKMTCNCSV